MNVQPQLLTAHRCTSRCSPRPWISVPPPGYGGVETVVSALTDALVARGHDVVLFCAPGSRSHARVQGVLDESHPDEIERSPYECDHVARAFAKIDRAALERGFDVVHDHCGFTALAMADRLGTPLVHGPFTPSTAAPRSRRISAPGGCASSARWRGRSSDRCSPARAVC